MKMDEVSLECQIAEELANLDETFHSVVNDHIEESSFDCLDEVSESAEDLPSMLQYVDKMRAQTESLEKELQECDELLFYSSKDIQNEDLKKLAEQEGLDVVALKQKVISELEEEERHESHIQLSNTAHNVVTDLLVEAQYSASHPHSSATNKDGFFVTASEEVQTLPDGDSSEPELPAMEGSQTSGTVCVVPESDLLERQMLQEVLALDHRNRTRQQHWIQEKKTSDAVNAERDRDVEERRRQSRVHLEEEQHLKTLETLKREDDMRQECDRLQAEIQQSLEKFEHDMNHEIQHEAELWRNSVKQEEAHKHSQHNAAAIKIQKQYRGYRVRKFHGKQVEAALAKVKAEREMQHLQELEILIEERQWQDRRKKEAEERKHLQEEEDKRLKKDLEKKEQEEKEWMEELERRREREREQKQERLEKQEKLEKQERLEKQGEKRKKEEEKRKKIEEKNKREEEQKKKQEEQRKREKEQKKLEKEQKKQEKEYQNQEGSKKQEMEKVKRAEEEKKESDKDAHNQHKIEPKKDEGQSTVNKVTDNKEAKMEIQAGKKNVYQLYENNQEANNITLPVDKTTPESIEVKNGLKETVETKDVVGTALLTKVKDNTLIVDQECDPDNFQTGLLSNTKSKHDYNDQLAISKGSCDSPVVLQRPMDVVGQQYVPADRGVTDLVIDKVSTANCVSPELTPRKVVQKTPRPPSEQKIANVVYERPHTAKKQSNTQRNSLDQNLLSDLCVGTPRKTITGHVHKLVQQKKPDMTQDWGEFLPLAMDELRLTWIKHCKPLSSVMGGDRKQTRKNLRRPSSAKKLPALSEQTVLTAAAAYSLREVSTVSLCELPGCTLSTLRGCPDLQVLCITDSQLPSTDGLTCCSQLRHLCIHRSGLCQLNLRDLVELVFVDVSHNSISTLTGLEGCTALRYLDVSHNNITRLGDLSLKELHTLDASSNQLVSTRGLGACGGLQSVNLSHNHLSMVDDLAALPLLQQLNISHNTLMQVPALNNQVLLQQLSLGDNNICFLAPLTRVWLPLLTQLLLDNNSVGLMEPFLNLLLLQQLQLENNQISDLSGMVNALLNTRCLHNLTLKGNPVCEDIGYREEVVLALPYMETLDGTSVSPRKATLQRTEFERLCECQVEQTTELSLKYKEALQKPCSLLKQVQVHKKYFETSRQMAVDFRYTHEYGVSMVTVKQVDMNFECGPVETRGGSVKSEVADMKSKFEAALQGHHPTQSLSFATRVEQVGLHKIATQTSTPRPRVQFEKNLMKSIALANQSSRTSVLHSNGYDTVTSSRVEPDKKAEQRTVVDAHRVNRLLHSQSAHLRQQAAINIQAWWRGVHLRKQLDLALTYARLSDLDDLDSLGEVDLGELDFMMADIEKELCVPDTPALPQSHPVLGKPPTGSPQSTKPWASVVPASHLGAEEVKHAWRNRESALSGRPPLPPLSRLSDNPSCDTQRSRKTDRIAEEWGFKNTKTAELMMARAKKLKYNAAHRHKLSQLDPKQRLALFRKLEENSNLRPLLQPRKQLPRKEYFQAREMEVKREQFEKQFEQHDKSDRTFEWVHTQVEMGTPKLLNRALYGSEGCLPRMEAGVMTGQTRLIGSPVDLQSVESSSTLEEPAVKPRKISRNSAGSGERLPPILPNSAPSVKAKERLSFRNPPTNMDVGWGGGKKRGKKLI